MASLAEFPWIIPVLPCCEPDLSLPHTPRRVDGLEGWEWSLGSSVRPLCLCCGHIPSLPPPGAGAVPQPLLRAWIDSWLSPFQLEQPKISDLVQEEPVPPSHGAHLRSSSALPSPGSCWKKQGWGGPAWLILLSVLWYWISEVWTTAGCGGQAEPATSTCPGLTGSDLPGFRA